MSAGSAVPYRLRPNKAVDRELFLALLSRVAVSLNIEGHQYISLGGPFLEDFRLVHARFGIENMVCIESEEAVHKRQLFNRPVDYIECVHSTLEDFLDKHEFEPPVILWLDYTEPSKMTDQIERFAQTVFSVPLGSVVRITLNAAPASLGKPAKGETRGQIGEPAPGQPAKPTELEWRLQRFQERLGTLFPAGLVPDDMTYKRFGRSVLSALKLAVEKEALSHRDRKVVWALATHYADGQPMVTATLVVCAPDEQELLDVVMGWEYFSTPADPHILDLPSLSTRERLEMECGSKAKVRLAFDLPRSEMGTDPYESFNTYYRIFPHFSRVEL